MQLPVIFLMSFFKNWFRLILSYTCCCQELPALQPGRCEVAAVPCPQVCQVLRWSTCTLWVHMCTVYVYLYVWLAQISTDQKKKKYSRKHTSPSVSCHSHLNTQRQNLLVKNTYIRTQKMNPSSNWPQSIPVAKPQISQSLQLLALAYTANLLNGEPSNPILAAHIQTSSVPYSYTHTHSGSVMAVGMCCTSTQSLDALLSHAWIHKQMDLPAT